MRRFIVKILIFSIPVFVLTCLFFYRTTDGYSDIGYLQFTTPKQKSLILGTSRASMGLNPAVFDSVLNRNDVYNFSFTIVDSPYGPVYLNATKRKLDPNSRSGVFVLTVDPWSISSKNDDPNDAGNFIENGRALKKVPFVNMNPNVVYMVQSYPKPFYKLLEKGGDPFLHNNGWLELDIPWDTAFVHRMTVQKENDYKNNQLPVYHPSDVRLKSLERTIEFLSEHGQVYLVRLPVGPTISQLDNELIPDFNQKMIELSKAHNIPYLDMTPLSDRYRYFDGNHIYRSSTFEVSRYVAMWMKELK